MRTLSKNQNLPILSRFSPRANYVPHLDEIQGFKQAQEIAFKSAIECEHFIKVGWSEKQAANLFEEILRDHGVKNFFHLPFVWFGENTRFVNVRKYRDFAPSNRRLSENEVVILDAAPIYKGFTCDIGHTYSCGENKDYESMRLYLNSLREKIPNLFFEKKSGEEIWSEIDDDIKNMGFENIHALYPFSVLGHRLHESVEALGQVRILNFEWNSYWNLLSRGVFGQILSPHYDGDLVGLWAIEPHIGNKKFGIKFEEILIVHRAGAYWLKDHL